MSTFLQIFHHDDIFGPASIYPFDSSYVTPKGVEPSTTLAWPGWKQPDIPVEVDTARLTTCRFKNGFAKCALLYCPNSEFESTFNVYWHGEGAAGVSCTELSIWEFPFLRGGCRQWGNSIWYWVNGTPQKDALENVRTPVCFRILSSSLTSVSMFSVWCYSSVSISVVTPSTPYPTKLAREGYLRREF